MPQGELDPVPPEVANLAFRCPRCLMLRVRRGGVARPVFDERDVFQGVATDAYVFRCGCEQAWILERHGPAWLWRAERPDRKPSDPVKRKPPEPEKDPQRFQKALLALLIGVEAGLLVARVLA
jgi:hypothetical protein